MTAVACIATLPRASMFLVRSRDFNNTNTIYLFMKQLRNVKKNNKRKAISLEVFLRVTEGRIAAEGPGQGRLEGHGKVEHGPRDDDVVVAAEYHRDHHHAHARTWYISDEYHRFNYH